jgi:2-oxoglutarate dehydrogenase complex dehydrogenase (E1) component-like enzyme
MGQCIRRASSGERCARIPSQTCWCSRVQSPKTAPARCTGWIKPENVAIARVEILYPFAKEQLASLISSYPNLKEIAWVQEEPRNMGARAHMSPRLMQILPEHLKFGYIGRPERAAPGEGYPAAHRAERGLWRLDLRLAVSVVL